MKRTPITRRPAANARPAAEWDQIFHLLKVRCGATCEARVPGWCLAHPATGSVEALPRHRLSIHHRSAKGMGGTDRDGIDDPGNLMLLCGDGVTGCHGWATVGDVGEARRRGIVLPIGHSAPETVPVELASGRKVLLGYFYEPLPYPYA